MRWRNLIATAFLFVGLSQMVGDIAQNQTLKGIGTATVLAPCPKVFCDINGLEPFASTFTIDTQDDKAMSFRITPEIYARLKGPYNRRNVYGAAVAGAPLLPERVRTSVLRYAFSSDGPLGRELGLAKNSRVILTVRTNTRGRDNVWTFDCKQ